MNKERNKIKYNKEKQTKMSFFSFIKLGNKRRRVEQILSGREGGTGGWGKEVAKGCRREHVCKWKNEIC
jgi:hypothetical protein